MPEKKKQSPEFVVEKLARLLVTFQKLL